MAEGYLKGFLIGKAQVYSAGVENHAINENAIKIMKRDGVDISQNESNHVSEYKHINFDFIITVCDHANETCPNFFSNKAVRIHKNFFDPSKIEDEEKLIFGFEKSRNEIKKFCQEFCATCTTFLNFLKKRFLFF
ncbi:MAG: protein-tyrosine-phosphatase [Flavobacteriaceae bacterium]|nr:MAG: protein-tyrosine-phosphatase [Flavobacteriaceae bacterium]